MFRGMHPAPAPRPLCARPAPAPCSLSTPRTHGTLTPTAHLHQARPVPTLHAPRAHAAPTRTCSAPAPRAPRARPRSLSSLRE